MSPGKYLAGGLQSGCTANSTGAQYKIRRERRKAGGSAGDKSPQDTRELSEDGSEKAGKGATEDGRKI
ncbi:MAG: hypothetical protein HFH84_09990 [Lachnospiraceae bacterium]|nr:hypothetical protein [Lachnospiraceae bacterium]